MTTGEPAPVAAGPAILVALHLRASGGERDRAGRWSFVHRNHHKVTGDRALAFRPPARHSSRAMATEAVRSRPSGRKEVGLEP